MTPADAGLLVFGGLSCACAALLLAAGGLALGYYWFIHRRGK